jgi:hypothetical protein
MTECLVRNEEENLRKEAIVAYFAVLTRYLRREIQEYYKRPQFQGQDLNTRRPEYEY